LWKERDPHFAFEEVLNLQDIEDSLSVPRKLRKPCTKADIPDDLTFHELSAAV
jgi:hypothetical protein